MESLPTEILTYIFTFLPPVDRIRLERVSKSWRKASRNSWASIDKLCVPWDRTEFYDDLDDLILFKKDVLLIKIFDPRIFHSITVRVKKYITSMDINLHDDPESRRIHLILTQHFRKIEVLSYHVWPQLDEDMLNRIIRRNKKLHSIESSYLSQNIRSVPRRRWRALRFQYQRRDSSTIEFWENLIIPAMNSRSFEVFEFFGMWSSPVMEEVLKQTNLRHLDITSIHSTELLDYILEIPMLQNLKSLHLENSEIMDNVLANLLREFSLNHHGLEELTICDIRISIETLSLISTLPQLITLWLQLLILSDEHLIHLTCYKNLKIEFNGNNDFYTFTEDGLINMIVNSEKLEKLDLQGLNVTPEMFEILVLETINRPSSIKILVIDDILDEVLEICEDSKIQIICWDEDDDTVADLHKLIGSKEYFQ